MLFTQGYFLSTTIRQNYRYLKVHDEIKSAKRSYPTALQILRMPWIDIPKTASIHVPPVFCHPPKIAISLTPQAGYYHCSDKDFFVLYIMEFLWSKFKNSLSTLIPRQSKASMICKLSYDKSFLAYVNFLEVKRNE